MSEVKIEKLDLGHTLKSFYEGEIENKINEIVVELNRMKVKLDKFKDEDPQ